MINQLLAVSFGVPATYLVFTLLTFLLLKKVRAGLRTIFNEVTRELKTFMKKGIPVPTDYKRIDIPFTGEPVLRQPELHVQDHVRTV